MTRYSAALALPFRTASKCSYSPDRVRAWARAKAHGRSPLTSDPRKPGLNRASTSTNTTAATTAPSDIKPEATTEPAIEGEKAPEKKKNFFTVFLVSLRNILLSSYVNALLVFVPVGIAVKCAGLSPGIVFAMNAIAIIPLAGLLSQATEAVAIKMGDTIGALMNVTFGNAVELIIFMYAPRPAKSVETS